MGIPIWTVMLALLFLMLSLKSQKARAFAGHIAKVLDVLHHAEWLENRFDKLIRR
jgi:hypothetical protein